MFLSDVIELIIFPLRRFELQTEKIAWSYNDAPESILNKLKSNSIVFLAVESI